MVERWVPERGDVAWLDLSPQAGHEQSGRRPALILSPAGYNGLVGMALACPITSQVKGYPFEVAIPEGLKVTGVVLSDQVRSFDWRARNASFICRLPPEVVTEVFLRLRSLLPQ